MKPTLASSIDAFGRWRRDLDSKLRDLHRFLADSELLEEDAARQIDSLQLRLSADKLVVAFVAEFSRGKSELINAIFFADTRRRILPATPGRTTMCPVELGYDASEPPGLALLPIETRLDSLSLAELRTRPHAWKLVELDPTDPEGLAAAMLEVTTTRWVSKEEARALGFWSDDHPADNPTTDAQGRVEVPAWRHAMINFPHPLLRQGLVILDTPGLNAIGAEPELTLGLLPSAHAAVFILGADTGVTRSDLSVWTDHLGPQSLARFVALNKIDAVRDPLLSESEVEAQIQRQREQVGLTLGLSRDRVFPLSAREALAARISGNTAALDHSRLPALEEALSTELLPRRREVLGTALQDIAEGLHHTLTRKINDRRRQMAEQLIELRGLRGKNSGKVGLLLRRVETESAEFEQCVSRLQAMRSVHGRMLNDALAATSSERVREAVETMRSTITASVLNLGARRAFGETCTTLRNALAEGQSRSDEIHAMLTSYFARLNADFGFSLAAGSAPDLSRFRKDLDLIERNYEQYLGFTQALKLSQPRFLEQFRRMLVSRLRVVFEGACTEIEHWNKTASALVDGQLRDRRKDFRRRKDSLERIQGAGAELESRVTELESAHDRLQQIQARLDEAMQSIRALAQALPEPESPASLDDVDAAAPEPLPMPPSTGGSSSPGGVDILLDFSSSARPTLAGAA